MTPYEIEFLLHYYYSPNDFPNLDCGAARDAIDKFLKLGLICICLLPKRRYHGNHEALEVYVNALCAVPLPVKKWVIPTN
jgi:hypothetical protein